MTEENLTTAPNEEESVEEISEEVEETKPAEETPERETAESEDATEEPPEADITAKQMYRGFTQTRQKLAAIEEKLEGLSQKKPEYGDEDEPLTVKKFQQLQSELREAEAKEKAKMDAVINSQLEELRVFGKIKSKEDEDELFKFAVKHHIKDLSQAADILGEVKEAKRISKTEEVKAKAKFKQEEGSKVGTSSKTKTEPAEVFNYDDISGKSWDELLEE